MYKIKQSIGSLLQTAKQRKGQTFLIMVVALLVIATGINYFRLQSAQSDLGDPERVEQQTEEYLSILNQLTYPPNEERPDIAIIGDIEEARRQNPDFYRQAKNGDVVLVYSSIAYIVDPQDKKLINIGSVGGGL